MVDFRVIVDFLKENGDGTRSKALFKSGILVNAILLVFYGNYVQVNYLKLELA